MRAPRHERASRQALGRGPARIPAAPRRANRSQVLAAERVNPEIELSVVVPVCNEAENILPLLAEIHAALEPLCGFEVICVDDGSEDRSLHVLREAQAAHPRLRVLTHRRP